MLKRSDLIRLLDEMIEHQHKKVLSIAREFIPGVTPEDLRNPQDYPELMNNSRFNFEDGVLAGFLGVRMALLNEINRSEPASEEE
ncbi:MAG: hypothetical protein JXR73_11550 [Candidatus Omnitrophica bacterium]|nr:hypothetical protein [Candidatus Omnitrophota bacterium]